MFKIVIITPFLLAVRVSLLLQDLEDSTTAGVSPEIGAQSGRPRRVQRLQENRLHVAIELLRSHKKVHGENCLDFEAEAYTTLSVFSVRVRLRARCTLLDYTRSQQILLLCEFYTP